MLGQLCLSFKQQHYTNPYDHIVNVNYIYAAAAAAAAVVSSAARVKIQDIAIIGLGPNDINKQDFQMKNKLFRPSLEDLLLAKFCRIL